MTFALALVLASLVHLTSLVGLVLVLRHLKSTRATDSESCALKETKDYCRGYDNAIDVVRARMDDFRARMDEFEKRLLYVVTPTPPK